MQAHKFLFSQSDWIGQGKLTFSHSAGHLRFYTKWIIQKQKDGFIHAEQHIEQEGESDRLFNSFTIASIAEGAFEITLSNELMGTVHGHGIIDAKTIAWEFKRKAEGEDETAFEGFEVYELQDNGDYMLHAEYLSANSFRTIIDGRIWQKA